MSTQFNLFNNEVEEKEVATTKDMKEVKAELEGSNEVVESEEETKVKSEDETESGSEEETKVESEDDNIEESTEERFNKIIEFTFEETLDFEGKKDVLRNVITQIRDIAEISKQEASALLKKNSAGALSYCTLLENILNIPNETGFITMTKQIQGKLSALKVQVTNVTKKGTKSTPKISKPSPKPVQKESDKVIFDMPIEVYLHTGSHWGTIAEFGGLNCEEIRKQVAEQYPYYELDSTNYHVYKKEDAYEVHFILQGMNKKG